MHRSFYKLATLICLTLIGSDMRAQDTLNAMTYNIRMNTPTDGVNAWPKRKTKVYALIQKYNPDILGMQEVLHLQYANLSSALKAYGHVGVGRNDGKKQGEYSPIFYKKDKYKLLQWGTFWLSETPNVAGSKSWDANITRICTWALFVSTSAKDTFYVFNTHFDHKGVTAREKSAALLCDSIQAKANKHLYLVMGDFNFTDTSPAYNILRSCKATVIDSYKERLPENTASGTAPGFKVGERVGNRIDYIFHSPRYTTLHTVIPNDNDGVNYPSDHLPYQAYLLLKK